MEGKKEIKQKIFLDYMQAPSLRLLLDKINSHNEEYPDTPILKEDIVQLEQKEGTCILLYYK